MEGIPNLYKDAMDGIGAKIAMQAIRKVMRDNKTADKDKLEQIRVIVHSFEKDMDRK